MDGLLVGLLKYQAYSAQGETLEEVIMPTKFDRITTNPEVMNGQPCVRDL